MDVLSACPISGRPSPQPSERLSGGGTRECARSMAATAAIGSSPTTFGSDANRAITTPTTSLYFVGFIIMSLFTCWEGPSTQLARDSDDGFLVKVSPSPGALEKINHNPSYRSPRRSIAAQ